MYGAPEYVWGEMGLESLIYLDIPQIKDRNPEKFAQNIESTMNKVRADSQDFIRNVASISSSKQISILVLSPLTRILANYLIEVSDLRYIMMISVAPLILISLFLLYFSLSLIEKRKEKIFNIMMMRGSSKNQMRGILFNEILVTAVIAVLVGMSLSIPTAALLLRSSGLLEFNLPPIALMIPNSWYWRLPLLGMLLAIDFNMIGMLNISKLNIEKTLSAENVVKPFWQRWNLDLILFSLSIIYWIIVLNVPPQDSDVFLFYTVLGPIAMGLTLISFPLVIGRYFILFLGRATRTITSKFDMLGLAVKNLNKNKNFTSQLVALLLTSLMLAYISIIVPVTMIGVSTHRSHYNLGADIYLTGFDTYDESNWNLGDIPEISGVTEIRKLIYEPAWYEQVRDVKAVDLEFLGINTSTFNTAAFWENNYAKSSLKAIENSIQNETTDLVMQSGLANSLGLSIGDSYEFLYGFRNSYSYEFKLVNTFTYFPNLVETIPKPDNEGIYNVKVGYVVGGLNAINLLSNLTHRAISLGAYIKLESNADVDDVLPKISNKMSSYDSIELQSYENKKTSFLGNYENDFLISSMHATLMIAFLVCLTGILYYTVVTLSERKKEIGIYRAFGMVQNQVVKLLFAEILLIVFTSVIFGILAGTFASYATFLILSESAEQSVPPFSLYLPYKVLFSYSLLILAVSLICALIPTMKYAKEQTGNILRVE